MKITNKNYKELIASASLFTTGGGVGMVDQMLYLKGKKINTEIKQVTDFSSESYICAVAELGPTSSQPVKKIKFLKKMRSLLELVTGKRISGLYSPEIGQECIVLEAATFLRVPIADFTPVGMRAVPCVDIHIFNILKRKFRYSPIVALTDAGDIVLIPYAISDMRLEEILRHLTSLPNTKSLFVMGGFLNIGEIRQLEIENIPVYSQIFPLNKERSLQELLQQVNPRMTIHAKVIKTTEYEVNGFFSTKVIVESGEGKLFSLIIMNEVLFLLDNTLTIIASVPERILIIHPTALKGVSATELQKGKRIVIAVIEAEKVFQTKAARHIFGKERFQFLLEKSL